MGGRGFTLVEMLRVSKRTFSIQATAALTSNSSARLTGNITVDGRNHSVNGALQSNNGNTGACNENKPAVTLTDSTEVVNPNGSVNLDGHSSYAGRTPPYTDKNSNVVYVTPEDVLGLQPGDLDAIVQTAADYGTPVDSIMGMVYVNGDYGSGAAGGNNLSGTGILIVHNPLFNPREHDPSDALYDAAKASDPDYAPANLGNINGGDVPRPDHRGQDRQDRQDQWQHRHHGLGGIALRDRCDNRGCRDSRDPVFVLGAPAGSELLVPAPDTPELVGGLTAPRHGPRPSSLSMPRVPEK